MSTQLTSFLIQLGEDPSMLRTFRKNPQALLEKAGLSPLEEQAVLGGDGERIGQLLLDGTGSGTVTPLFVTPVDVFRPTLELQA